MQENGSEMQDKGKLIAQVFTARQAVPIPDVSVSVLTESRVSPELLAFRRTDRNGKTEPMELPAPNSASTLQPSEEKGFATYNVQLDHPKYYSVLVEHVQVFAGVESIQPMEMVPLPEFSEYGDQSRIYVISPQDL